MDIAIFRLDRQDVELALKAAAARGVRVTALIAFSNRGGERRLRQIELRLLAAGIIVARTSDDLIRYHGKYIIIDRRVLLVRGRAVVNSPSSSAGTAIGLSMRPPNPAMIAATSGPSAIAR